MEIRVGCITHEQITQESLHTFVTPSMLVQNPVKQLSFLSILSTIYHKTNPNPIRQSKYFSSPRPIYQKVYLTPVRQFKCFQSTFNDSFRLRFKISQMYVTLKNYIVITKYVLAIITGALRFVLQIILGNHANFKWAYICSFQKRYCLN